MPASNDPAAREIISTRLLNAPREQVFKAFTDPNRLAQWWGPKGFTNDFHEFDPRPGGRWRFTMRGPDGTHYELAKDFIEVAEPERIVYQNLQQGHRFQMTMIFTDRAGQTELTWRMLFDPDSDYDKVKALVAEANEQNFDRLEAHLANTP